MSFLAAALGRDPVYSEVRHRMKTTHLDSRKDWTRIF
jgi:hypothetical protein